MCGIVGIVAKKGFGFSSNHLDIFENMLIANSVRGDDSTGVYAVTNKNQIPIMKQAVEPGMFLRTNTWKNLRQDVVQRGMVIVGHNRAATSGAITSKNAHPFVKDGIVLVHNGYIGNSSSIDKTVEVDSESIVTALVESKGDYVKALERISGAWAIAWYNQKTKKLYLTHNGERPLAICHTDEHLYFASEGGMLEWLLSRRRLNHQEPIELKVNCVYEITWKSFDIACKDLPMKIVVAPHNHRVMHQQEWLEGDMCGLVDPIAFREMYPDLEDMEDDPLHPLDRGGDQQESSKPVNASAHGPSPNDEPIELMKRMFRTYPQHTTMMFRPTGHMVHEKDITVHGVCWVPGKETFNAGCILDKTKETDNLLFNWTPKRAPLMAEVAAVARRGDDVRIGLKKIRDAKDKVKDSMGQELSNYEWALVAEAYCCDKCAKMPEKHQVDFVTVNRTPDGEYSIVCADCLTSPTKKTSAVSPDDKQDRPTVNT